MSEQTKDAFQDLISTIDSKLTALREQPPLNQEQFPTSFNTRSNNTRRKPFKAVRGRGKYKSRGRGQRRQYHAQNDPIATDTSQFKKSVQDFTNNTEKKQWYYQQFSVWYNKLPSHLQTKYDAPSLVHKQAPTQATDDSVVDYAAILQGIGSNYKAQKPAFRDNHFQKKPHYIHWKVNAPVLKKRKLANSKDEPLSENEVEKKEQNLARELVETEQQRHVVWKYYDETTSWYYSRYLYYASQVIKDHWTYVRREEDKGRINPRQKVYMAEYTKEELERHLAISPPDWFQKEGIPEKYWYQRYRYFSKYDEGIRMDAECWYSVTPEKIALNIAQKCKCHVIVDAMCGAGANAIAFAQYCDFVIAIDIDANKVKMAQHNAKIYGVEHKIQFMVADFFDIARTFMSGDAFVDVVFLSPPWGGEYYAQKQFDIRYLGSDGGMNGEQLFKVAQLITPNVAYFLPKNTNYRQLQSLCAQGEECQVTRNHLFKKVKAMTAYYGNLCEKNKNKFYK